ncbi:hypothetical protein AHAS_Ahas04G0170800 [Arachis hypogaea]
MDGMHACGLRTSKILGYMAGIIDKYSLLGFTKKDAYNYIDRTKRAKVVDGDTNAAIIFFCRSPGTPALLLLLLNPSYSFPWQALYRGSPSTVATFFLSGKYPVRLSLAQLTSLEASPMADGYIPSSQ